MEQKIQREIENKIKSQLEALMSPDTSDQRVLVDPPACYGEHPTLDVPARVELRKTLFTCLNAKSKFTGDKGGPAKGEMSSAYWRVYQEDRHKWVSVRLSS